MIATRTGALVLILIATVGAGVLAAWSGGGRNGLDCAPSDIRWMEGARGRIARCMPGARQQTPPAAQAITAGVKLDLNALSEAELTVVPGIGDSLARAIVERRKSLGGFRSWSEVDRVRGVGPAKVKVLQALTEIRR